MIPHIHADGTEWNFTGIAVRTILTDFLVGKNSAQYFGQGLFIPQGLNW